MLKGEVRITIGGFDGFTQMMGHCYADCYRCYRFPFSALIRLCRLEPAPARQFKLV